MSLLITVEPFGGLGNRMRALASSIALARALDRPLRLVWFVNADLGCSFRSLFEVPLGVTEIEEHNWKRPGGRLYYEFKHRLRRLRARYYGEDEVFALIMSGHDFPARAPARPMIFRTCRAFWETERPFDCFVPVAELAAAIARQRRDHQVGVHIRRTDNVDSIKNSPTSAFIELMEVELRADPEAVFFLATDAPEEEALLRERFPGRIHVHEKTTLRRGDERAVRDALVDLYALAGCRKIIGSYWSSFTDVASRIRGAECVVVKRG